MSRPPIPWNRIRELMTKIKEFRELKKLKVRFINYETREEIEVGGYWDNIKMRYLNSKEIEALPKNIIKLLNARKTPEITLSTPQWEFLQYSFIAMHNDQLVSRGIDPIEVVMMHGARRTGKSIALYAVIIMLMIARPASLTWVVGLRMRHGNKIITKIRHKLRSNLWAFDRREQKLRLVNGSVIRSKAKVNYDNDRGEELDLLALDEGAFMSEDVFDVLHPSTASVNGFTCIASSPNLIGWYHKKRELAKENIRSGRLMKTVFLKPIDNVFNPIVAIRSETAKYTMSKQRYKMEMLGEVSETEGLVLPGFGKNKKKYLRDSHTIEDATGIAVRGMTGKAKYENQIKYIVGVDYNAKPATVGAIMKVDTNGDIWYIGEVSNSISTEHFGVDLYKALQDLKCDDPHAETIIIGDASGEYQEPKDKLNGQSATILRLQGWIVERPSRSIKRNPLRIARMEVMRSLHLNAADEIHLWIDPRCEKLIETFKYLPLNKQGLPDKSNDLNHWYDAASYPAYRLWGDLYARRTAGQRAFGKTLVAPFEDPREKNT